MNILLLCRYYRYNKSHPRSKSFLMPSSLINKSKADTRYDTPNTVDTRSLTLTIVNHIGAHTLLHKSAHTTMGFADHFPRDTTIGAPFLTFTHESKHDNDNDNDEKVTCMGCNNEYSPKGIFGHTRRCSKFNDLLASKGRNRLRGHGYQSSSRITTTTSHKKFAQGIKLSNARRNPRATTYSSQPLWVRPSIQRAAQASLAKIHNQDTSTILSDDESADAESTFENDTLLHTLDDHQLTDIVALDDESLGDVCCDFDSLSGSECDDDEDDDDNPDDEDDEWEDVDYLSDEAQRLRSIRQRYRSRWAKFCMSDGYVHGSSATSQPFQYRDNLHPYQIAQISLLKILSQHQGNDLNLFDRILTWAGWFSDKYPDIWATRHQCTNHTRKPTINFLSKFFDTHSMLPDPKEVLLTDGSKVTIPVFDFKTVFERMLTDPEMINDENLIQDNFDKDTWRPIRTPSQFTDDDFIGDLATGTLYQEGIDLYCNGPPPPGIDLVLPCPIIAFTDESHHCTKGGNKTKPVTITLGVFRHEFRSTDRAWCNIGFIPNYGVGRGKNYGNFDDDWEQLHNKKRGMKKVTPQSVSDMKVKDHQIMYDAVLSSFREFCDTYGGLRMNYKGKTVLVRPFLHLLCGDTKEFNEATNHFNCCGNATVNCLMKCCQCSPEDFITRFPPECTRTNLAHIERSMEDPVYAKSISQHQVESVWNQLPISDVIHGISGMTPVDLLHMNGQGNCKDNIKNLHDMIGEGQTKKSVKEQFDLLFIHVAGDMARNSERRIPLIARRGCIMDCSRTTGGENVGNNQVATVCLCTDRGGEIMRLPLQKAKVSRPMLIKTLELFLAYHAWCNSPRIRKWELDHAGPAVSFLMQAMMKNIPDEKREGSNGYIKIKFHALWSILSYMRKYGSARNFTTEQGERKHKESVKKNGNQTQRRPASFTLQCGQRDGERAIIDYAHKYVRHQCPPDDRHTYDICSIRSQSVTGEVFLEDTSLTGRYEATCPVPTSAGNLHFELRWNSSRRTVAGIELNKHFLHCLTSWALSQNWQDNYEIEGYTELKVSSTDGNTFYRCSGHFHGGPWYDWAFIQDPNTPSQTYVGMILGFFKYKTPGFPSYRHIIMEQSDPAALKTNNTPDNTIYAVVLASNKEISLNTLEKSMVTKFRVTNGDDAYMIPIECIKRPLVIVKNYGSKKSTDYLHVLPEHKWAQIFSNKIEELNG